MEIYKEYAHNPPHLFRSDSKYFITGSIYLLKPFLYLDKAKEALLESINIAFSKFDWVLEDWVILHNHYHLMVNAPENATKLSHIIKEIHKFNALWIKKNVEAAKNSNKVWYNYWDTCITFEKSYYSRLNYIWNNPVKHGYVENAEDWRYGSFYLRIKSEKEYLYKIRKIYPCDKVNIQDNF